MLIWYGSPLNTNNALSSQDQSVAWRHDLGNLGGTGDPAILGVGNVAFAINNQGQVAGVSALQDNKSFRAFLWSKRTGRMQSLGTLPGDVNSGGLAMPLRRVRIFGATS